MINAKIRGYEYFKLNDFRDPEISKIYQSVVGGSISSFEIQLKAANKLRSSSKRKEQIKAACIYLAASQHVQDGKIKLSSKKTESAMENYHYAAHIFRNLEQLERAAQCYFNSSLRTLEILHPNSSDSINHSECLKLGLRSAGRAKGLFSDLGEEEHFDNAHRLRLDLKRQGLSGVTQWPQKFLFSIWKLFTNYGTSVSRWAIALISSIIFFWIAYAILIGKNYLSVLNSLPVQDVVHLAATSFFVAIINLFSFGAYTNITPLNFISEAILILQAISAFILIGTGVTFLTKR